MFIVYSFWFFNIRSNYKPQTINYKPNQLPRFADPGIVFLPKPELLIFLFRNLDPGAAFFELFVVDFLSPFFPFGVNSPIVHFFSVTKITI
jgi:hypothetical protein